jgi:hypothetical protein
MNPRNAGVALVLAVVYIDMFGIGLAFPILPRLIRQSRGWLRDASLPVRWA